MIDLAELRLSTIAREVEALVAVTFTQPDFRSFESQLLCRGGCMYVQIVIATEHCRRL